MSRVAIILTNDETRERAARWVMKAPRNARFELKEQKRSLPQNDKMWAMLTEIARQKPWHGVRLSADDFKLIFLDALKAELRIVPNLNGDGFVNLGRSSSDLTVGEMADLITLITEWGERNGVQFSDTRDERGSSQPTSQATPDDGVGSE